MTGKRKRRWPRRLFWCFAAILILTIAARLYLPTALVRVANAKLPARLGADFHVERVELILHRGFVYLRNGTIFHPKKFGAGVFIEVPEAWVT
ncbi:MAG: hypothetical protein NTV79_07095, partial [Candidatus Aureabacteria bacterium]|nr:hypothetical protein [Candidatus Auribacterota bacterium]